MKSLLPHNTEPTGHREALGQAKGNRIGIRCDLFRGSLQRDRRVEDARAIQMHRERAAIGDLAHFRQMRKLHRRAATSVVGVLDHHQRRHREVIIGSENFALEFIEVELAIVTIGDRREHDAAQRRCAAGFIAIGMRLVADDRLGAARAMREHRDQVAHGAAGDEQPRLLAHQRGGGLLEAVDGGVFAVDVVAELRARDRLAHLGRRQGYRVTAKINQTTQCPLARSYCWRIDVVTLPLLVSTCWTAFSVVSEK